MDDSENNLSKLPSQLAANVALAAVGGVESGVRSTVQDVWGGLFGDRIREWRTRNLVAALERTADRLSEKGIAIENAQALPNGELYKIFENASLTESKTLSEMWSELLTTAMTPGAEAELSARYNQALEQLAPNDANVFALIIHGQRQAEIIEKETAEKMEALWDRLQSYKKPEMGEKRAKGPSDLEKNGVDKLQRVGGDIIENQREALETLFEELTKKFSDVVTEYGDSSSHRDVLTRLGLIEPTNPFVVPDLSLDIYEDDVDLVKFEVADILGRVHDWMTRTRQEIISGSISELRLESPSPPFFTFRATAFGRRFADACISPK